MSKGKYHCHFCQEELELNWCPILEDWSLAEAIRVRERDGHITVAHLGCYQEFVPAEGRPEMMGLAWSSFSHECLTHIEQLFSVLLILRLSIVDWWRTPKPSCFLKSKNFSYSPKPSSTPRTSARVFPKQNFQKYTKKDSFSASSPKK